MGRLYECQPEREPVDYTHYDTWDTDPTDEEADTENISKELNKVLRVWSKTVGVTLWDSYNFGSFYEMMFAIGFELTMDLVVLRILERGFDVYRGDGFIEIYRGRDE